MAPSLSACRDATRGMGVAHQSLTPPSTPSLQPRPHVVGVLMSPNQLCPGPLFVTRDVCQIAGRKHGDKRQAVAVSLCGFQSLTTDDADANLLK
jgi:hypothetical protein